MAEGERLSPTQGAMDSALHSQLAESAGGTEPSQPSKSEPTPSNSSAAAVSLIENGTSVNQEAGQSPDTANVGDPSLAFVASKRSSDFMLEPLKVSPSYEDLLSADELSENFQTRGVRVVVRCRPLLAHEREHEQQCMTLDKESKSVTLQRWEPQRDQGTLALHSCQMLKARVLTMVVFIRLTFLGRILHSLLCFRRMVDAFQNIPPLLNPLHNH